ncbi:hypothetical protein C1637_19110 [Chryseobacterium lactis]|uniref:Uncharacterized protein n=1 Tax=Chryseobacterium lactis TaxID=1241981 RepID=A0A3G6RUS6_CHRLC|nr:tetratricopeptide repeat protein [Chryseobacterium lactis]AZA84892.1 hypothetical protein EG342_24620 [Chryseobacterium lactis]AZB05280.1 hypothetical protein EG341_15500 [Chryseobacterium lactis]PNW12263.1 hypothetical protein C1637_19110 [Chryseobacterium lactis]
MLRTIYFIIAITAFSLANAQTKTFKCQEIHRAIQLIDDEKYDEGIAILKDCEKKDPQDYTYPYEIAFAYIKKKDYKNAISQLEKVEGYSNIDDYYYALLGSAYDLSNNPNQALKVYDEGLKRFPASGKLYLEKGVVLELEKKISNAIESYEAGIKADPSYPSNYYRVSRLYLDSNDLLSGLMYGEIFINLERTTPRSQEISQLLYNGYKKAVKFDNNQVQVDFCPAIIDAQEYDKNNKLSWCIIFAKNFALSALNTKEINLDILSSVRRQFLKEYYVKDYKDYPNVLMDYHKTMENNKVFDAYNHYIFQIGDQEAFKDWKVKNGKEYNTFVEWYTADKNVLKIDRNNIYISDQIKK